MTIIVNGSKIEAFSFPGGERNVRLNIDSYDVHKCVKIKAFLRNANDIMDLLLTVDALRRRLTLPRIGICLPYLPYARQDRVCSKGEALSISVFSNIINSLKFEQVMLSDVHSHVSVALIENCDIASAGEILSVYGLISWIVKNKFSLICPDAGAIQRLKSVVENGAKNNEVIQCLKTRNADTGAIEDLSIYGNVKDKKCFIVDDICDGGRTFIEIAKALKKAGAKEIILYITHGIFSSGIEALQPFFDKIICLHTFLAKEEAIKHRDFLRVLDEDCFI